MLNMKTITTEQHDNILFELEGMIECFKDNPTQYDNDIREMINYFVWYINRFELGGNQ